MNTNQEEWSNLDWLVDARRLIEWTNNQDIRYPVMLVIRHSHREHSSDVQELREKRLTELGHRMALQFGEKLEKQREVEIFYSSHPRCHETAQDIAESYNANGGHARLISDLRVLLGPKGSGGSISGEMMKIGGPEFIKKWIQGEWTNKIIWPVEEFREAFTKEIMGRFYSASDNALQIHVTHDLVLMIAKYFLFGVMPSRENWTPFLGGFSVAMTDDQPLGYESGEIRTII